MSQSIDELRLVRVSAIRCVAVDTLSFDLIAADGRELEPFSPGSHIDVHLPNGLVRQYSLCGDSRDTSAYTIAVKKEAAGRGGSLNMHQHVEVGSTLAIAGPRNYFPLASGEHHSVFIAGGIGITPIRAMIQSLAALGRSWELHYCARSEAHAAFYGELRELEPGRVHHYFSETPLLDTEGLLGEVADDTHVYCCGPEGLMQAVKRAAAHWDADRVHFEWFSAPVSSHPPNSAFEVELKQSGRVLQIPPDRSILQVLRSEGIHVQSACEEGVCGTCETRVLGGKPEHRDVLLSEAERSANCSMMICVSRASSERIVLDL